MVRASSLPEAAVPCRTVFDSRYYSSISIGIVDMVRELDRFFIFIIIDFDLLDINIYVCICMWHIYVYTHTFQSSMKQNSYLLRNVVAGEIHPGRLV